MSHFNLVNNVHAINERGNFNLRDGQSFMGGDSVLVNLLPLYHVFGFTGGSLLSTLKGATSVYPDWVLIFPINKTQKLGEPNKQISKLANTKISKTQSANLKLANPEITTTQLVNLKISNPKNQQIPMSKSQISKPENSQNPISKAQN